MTYCFDTSAINALLDDADMEAVAEGLLASSVILITALNVTEAWGTRRAITRDKLLTLERRLSKGRAPLQIPNLLLQALTKAYASCQPRVLVSIGSEEGQIYWPALNEPSKLGEDLRQEVLRWQHNFEQPFKQVFLRARENFQLIFESGRAPRPCSRSALIKHYCKDDAFVLSYVRPIYKQATGAELSPQQLHKLFLAVPEWPLWLCGWALSIYERCIQQQGHGAGRTGKSRKKPGTLDLWCAIYLTRCDCFVTADITQRRALRILNTLSPRQPKATVISYDELRRRLLLGSKGI